MALLSTDEVRLRISAETSGGNAVEQLAQNIDNLARQGGEAAPALGVLANQIRRVAADADSFNASLGRSAGGVGQLITAVKPMAAAIATAFGVQEVARMAADFDSLMRSMGAIQGQGAKAAAEVGYITDAAQRLGLNLQTTAKAYTGWLASIKGTALEGEAGRKVFEAVAGSMAKLGKSAADTEGAMLALGQMVSKGTVSMEELRGQLAERLPGALQAAADGAGLTTAQLIKMVESGSVLAEDLLPGMAAQLQKLYGSQPVGGFVASWNQMTGAVTEAIGRIGQTDAVMAAVGITFGAVKETVLVLGTGILTVSEGFGLLGKTIGATAAAIASGNWSGLREEISKMASESAERINALASKTAIATGVQQAFGQAITGTGAAAEAASPKYLLIQSAYTEVTKAAAKYTDLVEKSLESRKAEQDLAVGMATEFGTEAEQRQAAARAASVQADALGIVALAKDAEAKITLSQIAATQAEADAVVAAGGKISQAKTDEIIKLKESAKLKVEEAARSLAAAEAANVHAAAVRTDTLTYADNSSKVNELREAWKLASASAETLRASLAAGIATKEQSAQADIAAGQAAKLYRDATADAVVAIQAQAAVQRAAIGIEEKGRSLQLAQIETQIAVAKARGRDLEVAKLQFEHGRVEMELSALKGKALRAEAEAQLALVAAKRAELEASGQMTEVKRLELKAAEQAAKAKMIDAQIADELASRARQLKDVVRGTSDAMDDATESTDKLGDSWSTAADKADRYSSSANRAAKAGKSTDGTMNPDGTINRTVFTSTSDNYTRGIDLGLTSDQAKVFATALSDEITRANAAARGKAQETAGVAFGVNDYVAFQQQAEQKALEYARNNTTSSTVSSAEKSVGNNFYGSSARTININLNGKSTSIRVANQTDADALVGTLQELAARS